jgi:hypothetical protein
MIDCKQAARLTSESQDRPLTWGERFQLVYHLGLCEMCRCYTRQMAQIRTLLRLSRERPRCSAARCRAFAGGQSPHCGGDGTGEPLLESVLWVAVAPLVAFGDPDCAFGRAAR